MAKMMVELEWNDELGEKWMNIDNLSSCLFTRTCTRTDLLKVTEVERACLVFPDDGGVVVERCS